MLLFDFWVRFKRFSGLNKNNPRQKQIFDFFWNIEISNVSHESVKGELFLPIPSELPSQKIIGEIVFAPAIDKISAEETDYNRYVFWKISLEPGEKKYFSSSFKAEIHPVNFSTSGKFFLDDYAKDELENETWLSANRFIQPQNPEIRKIAEEITGEEKDVLRIIKKINDYLIARLKYGQPISGLYSADDALKKETVDCGGFASLLVSLCLSLGIPARIVSGFWAGYSKNTMHVWAEIKLPDDAWMPADPTVENLRISDRTQKTGQLGFIGSDRIIFSHGCDFEITANDKKIKIDILQNPFYKGLGEEKIALKYNLKTKPAIV